jgi:hypothetical protein
MKNIFLSILFFSTIHVLSQREAYSSAFYGLRAMLEDEQPISFKKGVFLVENAYYDNALSEDTYNEIISNLTSLTLHWIEANKLTGYSYEDYSDFAKNRGVFVLMTDTIFIEKNKPIHLPFSYDLDDFFGNKSWSKQFVTKLLNSGSGNCHSMPYLYKILADEIGTKAYLSLAPNHIYIKQKSKNPSIGFYNTELTSKCFPMDAWVMTAGYVTIDQIMSNVYMDALNEKQSMALNLIDLAEGYKRKDSTDYDFVIQCCDLALKHFPHYINALLLKAETLKSKFEAMMVLFKVTYPSDMFTDSQAIELYQEMENTYSILADLHYKDVPYSTYLKWLEELANNIEKYNNKNVSNHQNN